MSNGNPYDILSPDRQTAPPVGKPNTHGNAGRDSKRHEPHKPEHGRQYDRQSGTGRGTEVRKGGYGKGGPGRNDAREQFKGESEARRAPGERRSDRERRPRDPAREEQRQAWEARRQEFEARRKQEFEAAQKELADVQANYKAATLEDIPMEPVTSRVEISRAQKIVDEDLLSLGQKREERKQRPRRAARQELEL